MVVFGRQEHLEEVGDIKIEGVMEENDRILGALHQTDVEVEVLQDRLIPLLIHVPFHRKGYHCI